MGWRAKGAWLPHEGSYLAFPGLEGKLDDIDLGAPGPRSLYPFLSFHWVQTSVTRWYLQFSKFRPRCILSPLPQTGILLVRMCRSLLLPRLAPFDSAPTSPIQAVTGWHEFLLNTLCSPVCSPCYNLDLPPQSPPCSNPAAKASCLSNIRGHTRL